MKTLNLSKGIIGFTGRMLAALAIVITILSLPALPAHAAQGEPPDEAGQVAEPGGLRLELGLKRMLVAVENLQNWLDLGRDSAAALQERIDEQKAAGQDTGEVEAALAEFLAQLDQAQASLDTAAGILAEKAGFDEDGKVIDREQARQTLESAGESMQETRQTMRQATQDLRRAVAEFIRGKRPEKDN